MFLVKGKIEKVRDDLIALNKEIKSGKISGEYSKESKVRVKEAQRLLYEVLTSEKKALGELRSLQNRIESFDQLLQTLAGSRTSWAFGNFGETTIMDTHPDWALKNVNTLLGELEEIKKLAKNIFKLEEKQ